LKKAALVVAGVWMFFCFNLGNVFAESALEKTVNELIGAKYRYGGASPEGFDCSGFTMYVFAQFGIELSHQSKAQAKEGIWVAKENLRPGDLVFFNTDGKGISHVGIYMGNGEFAHAATDDGIVLTSLNDRYYAKRYVTARRILSDEQYDELTTDAQPASDEQ